MMSASPRPLPPPHEDSGISVTSPPSTPTKPTTSVSIAEPSSSSTSVSIAEPVFTGDLSKDSPRILGGGPTYTVPPERRKEMLEALNASWTTSQNSMIPLEAERCFPKGPTAGPYRMIPRSENKPEEVLQPEKKEGALKRWLSRSSTRSVPAEKRAKGKNVEKLATRTSIDDITETVITEAEVPVAAASAKEKPETGMKNGLPTPTPSPTDDDDEEMDPGLDDRIQEIKPFAGGLKA